MKHPQTIGDIVRLRWHDSIGEEHLVNKPLEVIKLATFLPPFWIDVRFEGKEYSVRGSDCIPYK